MTMTKLTRSFFVCKVNSDLSAIERLIIHALHCFLGVVNRFKLNKCKPKANTQLAIFTLSTEDTFSRVNRSVQD